MKTTKTAKTIGTIIGALVISVSVIAVPSVQRARATSGSTLPTTLTAADCSDGIAGCGTFYSVSGTVSCTWTYSQGTCSDTSPGYYNPSIAEPNLYRGPVSLTANVETCGPNTVTYTGSMFGVSIPTHGNGTSGAYGGTGLTMTSTYVCTGGAGVANANYGVTGCKTGYTAGVFYCTKIPTCTIGTWTNSPSTSLTWTTSNCTSISVAYPGGSSTSLSGTVSSISSQGTCTITAQPGNVTAATINPCGPNPPVPVLSATLNDTGTSSESAVMSGGATQSFGLTVSNTGGHCSTGTVSSGNSTSTGGTGGSTSGYVNPGPVTAPCP